MRSNKKLILNARDILLRDKFTASEKLTFILTYALFILLIFNAKEQPLWISCIIIIMGVCSIINIKVHEIVHPFETEKIWRKLTCLNLPAIALIAINFFTAFNNPTAIVTIDGNDFIQLNKSNSILGNNIGITGNWLYFLSIISIFLLCTNLLIIPKSLYFINKLFCWCSASIYLIIFIGFSFKILSFANPSFLINEDSNNFFFYLAKDSNWTAFALLWMYVSFTISIIEYEKNNHKFRKSYCLFYLAICPLIVSSSYIIEPSASSLLLSFAFFHICFLAHNYFKKVSKKAYILLRPFLLLFSLVAIVNCIYLYSKIEIIYHKFDPIRQSCMEMFMDSPIFGWGMNSFHKLVPFYNNPYIINQLGEHNSSGVRNLLCDYGLIGVMIMATYTITLFFQYILRKQKNPVSEVLFSGLFLIIILSFFNNPFSSIPVVFSFWLIGFLSIRWAQIASSPADEVDTRRNLMISDKLRNIPFVTNPKKDVFK